MAKLHTPIHRSHVEFDAEEHAAIGRLLEELAAQDPKHQPALDAWREANADIDQWEAETRRVEIEARLQRKAA